MDLKTHLEFMYNQKIEFEKSVIKKAKKIRLIDIINEIKFNPKEFTNDFKEGQEIRFLLCQGHYIVHIKKEIITLEGYNINIKDFKGN